MRLCAGRPSRCLASFGVHIIKHCEWRVGHSGPKDHESPRPTFVGGPCTSHRQVRALRLVAGRAGSSRTDRRRGQFPCADPLGCPPAHLEPSNTGESHSWGPGGGPHLHITRQTVYRHRHPLASTRRTVGSTIVPEASPRRRGGATSVHR